MFAEKLDGVYDGRRAEDERNNEKLGRRMRPPRGIYETRVSFIVELCVIVDRFDARGSRKVVSFFFLLLLRLRSFAFITILR